MTASATNNNTDETARKATMPGRLEPVLQRIGVARAAAEFGHVIVRVRVASLSIPVGEQRWHSERRADQEDPDTGGEQAPVAAHSPSCTANDPRRSR